MARIVIVMENGRESQLGSAFCVHPAGYFLASGAIAENRVITGKPQLILQSSEADERVYDAAIVRVDKAANLALLKITGKGLFSAVEFGNAPPQPQAELMVFSFYSPAANPGPPPTVPLLERELQSAHAAPAVRLFQFEPAGRSGPIVNPPAGSPLIDEHGHVVAMGRGESRNGEMGVAGTGIASIKVIREFLEIPNVTFSPKLAPYLQRTAVTEFAAEIERIADAAGDYGVELRLPGLAGERLLTLRPNGAGRYTVSAPLIEAGPDQAVENVPYTLRVRRDARILHESTGTIRLVRYSAPRDVPPGLTALIASPVTVALPAPAEQMVLGGGGRFLILKLRSQRRLAVFDTALAQIVRFIPMAGGDVLLAASQESLFVYSPDAAVLQRWSLASLEREFTTPLRTRNEVVGIGIGSASSGPLLVLTREEPPTFYDAVTLERLQQPLIQNERGMLLFNRSPLALRTIYPSIPPNSTIQPSSAILSTLTIRPATAIGISASADGTTFVISNPQDAGWNTNNSPLLLIVEGNAASVRLINSGDPRWPPREMLLALSAGRHFFDYPKPAEVSVLAETQIFPSLSPLLFGGTSARFVGRAPTEAALTLYSAETRRPIGVLPLMSELTGLDLADRLFLVPQRDLLAVLSPDRSSLILRNLQLEVGRTETDILYVASVPVSTAAPGSNYRYALDVRTAHRPTTFNLDSGPAGMRIDERGELSWKVPEDAAERNEIRIKIRNGAGREFLYHFVVMVK